MARSWEEMLSDPIEGEKYERGSEQVNRDYKCLECGLDYHLSLERIEQDKPNPLSFVCDICLDI